MAEDLFSLDFERPKCGKLLNQIVLSCPCLNRVLLLVKSTRLAVWFLRVPPLLIPVNHVQGKPVRRKPKRVSAAGLALTWLAMTSVLHYGQSAGIATKQATLQRSAVAKLM